MRHELQTRCGLALFAPEAGHHGMPSLLCMARLLRVGRVAPFLHVGRVASLLRVAEGGTALKHGLESILPSREINDCPGSSETWSIPGSTFTVSSNIVQTA